MEHLIGFIFTLGLIAGLSALLSYFFELEFIVIFAVCASLFILVTLIGVGVVYFLTHRKKSKGNRDQS